MTDSSAFYDQVGDPHAFFLAQQHFARLKEVIVDNNDAFIKTIGDAVMAIIDPQHTVDHWTENVKGIEKTLDIYGISSKTLKH